MPCYAPLRAYKGLRGGPPVFSPHLGGLPFDLPCGQCRGCRAERARQWACRIMHESLMHTRPVTASEIEAGAIPGSRVSNCSFVTLTYHPSKLPPLGSLDKTAFPLFARRVRKQVGPFRYYYCGEYGDETGRPHYHACMFGIDFHKDRIYLTGVEGRRLYTSALLERLWGLGNCSVGNLDYESAAYVARYVMKKITGPRAEDHYSVVDQVTGEVLGSREPEFARMSRRPGIGSDWFDKYSSDVFPADEVVHKGKKHLPPKYYDGKLPEIELERYKAKRRAAALARREELTPQRLRVRESIAEKRAAFYERRGL